MTVQLGNKSIITIYEEEWVKEPEVMISIKILLDVENFPTIFVFRVELNKLFWEN